MLSRAATGALQLAARTGNRLGGTSVADLACSASFNLRHYQGIADELGGRAQFFASMARAAEAPVPGVLEDGAAVTSTAPLVDTGTVIGQTK